ncbi:MAG: hypothetical protein KAR45_17510 [Desulfobacteraceae bacterium]|nr:hypothetical protein [Desulfobacteraceae bacterium]
MFADAIIFIPGIKGTTLVETNRVRFDTIWSGVQSNFETIEDLELSKMLNDKYYDEKIDTIIKPGQIESIAYGEFLRDLKTEKPKYIFNYDWRMSTVENGRKLGSFVDYLIEKSKAANKPIKKFDFITHSLGNFILRYFIQERQFPDSINKIVFTVPPFKGAIDIASTVIVGEGFFPGVKAKIRKLIRTFPGALELLPTYPGASSFATAPKAHDFFNIDHWQKNITAKTNSVAEKFKEALSVAKNTVDNELCDISGLTQEQRDRILVICRGGHKTYQSLKVYRTSPGDPGNYFDFVNAIRNDNGDGRVPHLSSSCYKNDVLTLEIRDAFFFKDYGHGLILKDERVQRLVNRFLANPLSNFKYNITGGSITKL